MVEHEDLESYWEDVAAAKRSPLLVISGKAGDAKGGLELAAAVAAEAMRRRYVGSALCITDTIRAFADEWRIDLLRRGSGALVELILEDAKLTLDELKGYIRALPSSLVQRIVDNGAAAESARGIHALMSVEHLWRTRGSALFRRDYLLGREGDGTLTVTTFPAMQQSPEVVFRLDDTFDLGKVST